MNKIETYFVAGLLCFAAAAHAEPPTIPQFARFPYFSDVQISPTGTYIAARVFVGGEFDVAIVRLADRKFVARIKMGPQRDVAKMVWVSPERLLVEPAEVDYSDQKRPYLTGEIFGVNADGGGVTYLFGYQSQNPVLSGRFGDVEKTSAWAKVLAALPDDPDEALIQVTPWSVRDDAVEQTYRINVHTGVKRNAIDAPVSGPVEFLADRKGEVRYVVSDTDDQTGYRSFYRTPGHSDWLPLSGDASHAADALPLAFSNDGKSIYLETTNKDSVSCLSEQTLETAALRTLACDSVGDIMRVIFAFDRSVPIAIVFHGGVPRLQILDETHPDARQLKALQNSFPGALAIPWSSTIDGSKLVLKVESDREPGVWYLFDTKTKNAQLLFASHEWAFPADMGERRAVEFKSADGTLLHGFLTLPPGNNAQHLPLVINPHGGPLDVADEWLWDAEPQLLATRGYAVLQVNFRGSANYGLAFRNAGFGQVATGMIDDLTAGARWALAQGITDPGRLCIFGTSYGGYAALMSAVREPDLYKCAIGNAGVYDVPSQVRDSDAADSKKSLQFVRKEFGLDEDTQRKNSPLTYIDRLKAAVFIAHGEADKRVPFEQAKMLRKALDARHYPYEWLAIANEGHGFYSPDNRAMFYTRLVDFLDRNIGPHAGVPTPEVADKTDAPQAQNAAK